MPKRGQKEDMPLVAGHPNVEQFARDVRRALYQLYDYSELAKNPLFKSLELDGKATPMDFSDKLIEIIASLKPEKNASPASDTWRTYRILNHRFIDQFSQEEVASSLGLSIRQLRRQEAQAIRAFTNAVARQFGVTLSEEVLRKLPAVLPEESTGAEDASPLEKKPETQQNQDELDWLEQTAPVGFVNLLEILENCLHTIQPLADFLNVSLARNLPDALPGTISRGSPLLQALLLVITDLLRSGPVRTIEISTEANDKTLGILFQCGYQPDAPLPHLELANFPLAVRLATLAGATLEQSRQPHLKIALRLPVIHVLSVLFIDDNADTLHLYQRYLTDTRFQFSGVREPQEALALIASQPPHIILQDIMLPTMDGWELLGRLRAHPETRMTPIIVCSILPQAELAFTLGASAFLQKPVSREALLQALDQQAATLVPESN